MRVVSLLCDTPTGPALHFYKTSKYVLGYQSYGVHKILASGEITKKMRVVSLTCDMPTGPPLNVYQILYYLKQYESRPAEDFGLMGINYIAKTVRVVSFARDMPTGPPLHSYQTLSNYLKKYGSYGLHKILASGEITILRTVRVVILHVTHLQVLLFISAKHYQNMSKGIKVMACKRFPLQGR